MSVKPEFQSDLHEFETRDVGYGKALRATRMVESVRLGLTTLALLAGLTIVGTSAETLAVYNKTHLGQDFLLPLWPSDFDIRPTIALVTCGSIIFLASAVSLIASKVQAVRNRPLIHNSVSILASLICFIAGLIGMSFFYGVNASSTVFSLQAWTCQWSAVSMTTAPHWGRLCKESKVALYLTVMTVPLEVLVLGATAWAVFVEKKLFVVRERKGSPALS